MSSRSSASLRGRLLITAGALVALLVAPTIAPGSATASSGADRAAAATSVSGVVTRADTGAPVEGVDVLLFGEAEVMPVTTAVDGRYTVSDVPDGEYRLRFVPPAGSDLAATFWRSSAGWEGADPLAVAAGMTVVADMSLPVGATLAGRVTRAVDGSPVPGVTVYADGDSGSATAETAADGRYVLRGLNAGAYILEFAPPIVDDQPPALAYEYWQDVRSPDLATPVDVPAGGRVEGIDASLDATGSISGRVTRATDRTPVAGATVHLRPEDHTLGFSTTSRADGSYTLAGAVPGRHFVEVWTEDERLLDVTWPDAIAGTGANGEAVTVSAGGDIPGIDVALPAAAVVTGTVRMRHRTWTAGGTVTLDAVSRGGARTSGVVEPDGRFRIGKVVPARYVASVQPTADASRAASQFFRRSDTRRGAAVLDLRAGRVRDGVDFSLRTGVDLSGTVTVGGELSQPVEVTAYRWSRRGWEAVATTSTWGEFSFADPPGDVAGHYLPAGRYALGFTSEGYCTEFSGDARTLRDAQSHRLRAGDDRTGITAHLQEECPLPALRAGTPVIWGAPVVGTVLRAKPGAWRPRPTTVAYQWALDGEPLAGATAARLRVTAEMRGHRLTVTVTGSRDGYSDTSRTSRAVVPVRGHRR